MDPALRAAASRMMAPQLRTEVISNNLGNVNPTGFKGGRAKFEDLLYQTVQGPQVVGREDANVLPAIQVGRGVRLAAVQRLHEQGALEPTQRPLDLAIEGEGFFQVAMPDGRIAYTRSGNFNLSAEGQIVTSDGLQLQPQVQVPEGVESITIGADGTISAKMTGEAEATALGQIELARFVNPSGLQALGDNLFVESAASGAPQVGAAGLDGRGNVRQGMLEASNVNVVQELVDMIETQRAYEVNSKMISATDEMLRNANQQL